ncbi:MAG TPA: M15 family metallopeptidase [Nocardioidaceae bacterium]|nr:M15 family metallopeptidase [Nocardioidaceae bacterium]
MPVRRSRAASWPARGLALAGVPLLLAPLVGCGSEPVDRIEQAAADRGTQEQSEASPVGRAAATPSGSPSPEPTSPDVEPHDHAAAPPAPSLPPALAAIDAPLGPLAPPPVEEEKELEGGGFATAVPGSDAPDREVDVGPQYAVTDDLDIEEIERLVEAVEAIAAEQRVQQPLATGGSVAAAVGTFSYRWFDDGTVAPDPAWIAANIRTEPVPILGNVTCHRVMLPQLRGALREVVSRGLASEIHPNEYGGCYVPRFIGRDPSKGLSLHTWGIAVDLNVPGNLRGVPGEINRDVVAIFKKWGFAWGGDWAWTDPMHFELAQIVRSR